MKNNQFSTFVEVDEQEYLVYFTYFEAEPAVGLREDFEVTRLIGSDKVEVNIADNEELVEKIIQILEAT